VRSLARDLGEVLGCGAHLTRLVRLWVGSFRLEDAISLDEITAAAGAGRVESVLRSADDALAGLPAMLAEHRRVEDIMYGRSWPAAVRRAPSAPTRVYDTGGRLLGLAEHDLRRHAWQPRLALIQGPASANGTLAAPEDGRGGDAHDG
jgi:tRNA pseudouridine55 synthase